MAKRVTPETAVVRECMEYLDLEPIPFFRMNTGAFKNPKGGMYFFGSPGMADLVAFLATEIPNSKLVLAHPVWIECKAEGGKQSPKQKEFEAKVTGWGHHYVVVTTSGELHAFINALRLTLEGSLCHLG